MGFVAAPEDGKVYIDVGNAFCPGILDHHHPEAPDACTAMLVLNHPEYVVSQIVDERLTIIPHEYPDLDAVTGAYFAALHGRGEAIHAWHHDWVRYVCWVDQGFTALNAKQPITPYSLLMMRMHKVRKHRSGNKHDASLSMLKEGFAFLDDIFDWLAQGGSLEKPEALTSLPDFSEEVQLVRQDLQAYQADIQQAEKFSCKLPKKVGQGMEEVPGLWVVNPESVLFKSWARGDAEAAGNDHGFVFLGIQVSEHRFILSVDPASDVWLKGLGEMLEHAETEKRKHLGTERLGENRPGYDSPDPWYDGRSPLHNYTIIDAPRVGTVLTFEEVQNIFKHGYICEGI